MRNTNNPSCIFCTVTAAKPNLSTVIKLFCSGSGYHSHSFIIQIRLPETDGSLLSAYQSADPKHSITERIYHTHSGSSSASKCSAHIYAAQTLHATKPVEKKYLSQEEILLQCRNSRSPSRDASPVRPPPPILSLVHTAVPAAGLAECRRAAQAGEAGSERSHLSQMNSG